MRYILIVCLLGLLSIQNISAQNLTGTVTNGENEPLFGATVVWDGTIIGTVADENGYFELAKQDSTATLRIDYVGYESLYVDVTPDQTVLELSVAGITDLIEIEVAAKIRDNFTSTLSVINIETIGAGELRKAPCCNLAESFSTNAAIDVAYSDAVTGAREIRLLGLRGAYTQLLVEKRPMMSGLGAAFIMEYIPGTWLSGIQISKGASTVQNGYQSITGQINSELVKPFEDKRFFVNLYGSTFGRAEANIHLNHEFNEKWSSGLLLHASTRKNELDANDDTFYDTPQKTLYDGLFRTFYRGEFLRAQFNVHLLSDKHQAGQIASESITRPYTIFQNNDRVEFFGKVGYLGFDNPNHSVGFIANAAFHQLDAAYGIREHTGEQTEYYLSGLFSTVAKDVHKMDTGVSFQYNDQREFLGDEDYSRLEKVPGVFFEYSYVPTPIFETEEDHEDHEEEEAEEHYNNWKSRIGLVTGLRLDHHNQFGWLFTPRANLKYNFTEESVVRLSAGRGYRTANIISDNIGMLASSRDVMVIETLDIEDAWNFGFNFTQNFKVFNQEASFVLDLFRTSFTNQVVMDLDTDYRTVQFYNLTGKSFANSFLAVLSYELLDGLDMKLGYKFNDVKITQQDGELRERPMVAKHRGLITLDYVTPNKKWEFNTNAQFVGKQRFANLIDNPAHSGEHHLGETKPFTLVNAQVTFNATKQFEIYAGCENITNYTQANPIIDALDPFGEYFDANHIYAPITGAMAYIGVRFGIE